MPSLREVKQQIQATETIRMLTQALGDISMAKLKDTRVTMQHSVLYFQQLSTVYRVVKSISIRSKKPIIRKQKNERSVCILLTSNSRLYGGLDNAVTKFFFDNTVKLNCDRIVVGSFGADLLKGFSYPQPFEAIRFNKDDPTYDELHALAEKVFDHVKILVFYPKFKTLLSQQPYISDISTSYLDTTSSTAPFHYIAEPEIEKILSFFDNQIAFLLFQAIFLEVSLSRLAARMISMNQAEINANKELKKDQRTLIKLKRQIMNLRILETYSGREVKIG